MHRPLRPLMLLALAPLVLAGCGTSAGTPPAESPSAGPSAPSSSGAADTSVTVQFLADGESPSASWTLQCNGAAPVGSSEAPDPAAACAVLAEQGAALFAAPDPNVMCTQEVRGMQRAEVAGTVNGETVDREFSLRNGCEIGRWENLTALLGPAQGTL